MKTDFRNITNCYFISALLLLLLNDFAFKYAFSNWLTGKISDFAGLFVFALFWSAFFPSVKKHVFILTGLVFVFWKSSFSQPLIDGWNDFELLRITRVIDYSDLIALMILPVGFYCQPERTILPMNNLSVRLLSILCIFAFCSTSRTSYFSLDRIWIDKNYKLKLTTVEFWRKLDSLNITYETDPVSSQDSMYEQNSDTLSYSLRNVAIENDTLGKVAFKIIKEGSESMVIHVDYIQFNKEIGISNYEGLPGIRKVYRNLLEENIIEDLKKN